MLIQVQRTPRDSDHVGWGVFVELMFDRYSRGFYVVPNAENYEIEVIRGAIRTLQEIEKTAVYHKTLRDRLTGRTAGSEPANVGPNPAPSANERPT